MENNKHKELSELIQLIKDETIIKLHITQDINYLKFFKLSEYQH
jgi:hypothetical protein